MLDLYVKVVSSSKQLLAVKKMSDKWICNYWQYPLEKSQQKTVLFKMFITHILHMRVQYPIFTLIFF